MTNVATPPSNNGSPGTKPLPSKKRASDATPDDKPKRTRTGCLTCRERHLKCDESKPTCNNCLKSQRECNWGKKLNFLDTTCEKNAYLIPQGIDYQIAFLDESRTIASEYVGGKEMYPVEDLNAHLPMNDVEMPPPRPHPSMQAYDQDPYPQAQIHQGFGDPRASQQWPHSRHGKSDSLCVYSSLSYRPPVRPSEHPTDDFTL
jgi:hypothetical protein